MISFTLVVTLCTATGKVDTCDDYIADVLDTMHECTVQMAARTDLLDTKHLVSLACERVESE